MLQFLQAYPAYVVHYTRAAGPQPQRAAFQFLQHPQTAAMKAPQQPQATMSAQQLLAILQQQPRAAAVRITQQSRAPSDKREWLLDAGRVIVGLFAIHMLLRK